MKKTFYVTTPIFYPSGNLHIGHVYTTTLAWVLRNYKALQGYDAKMLTGADEHGQKIQEKAGSLNIKPQEYVNQIDDKFKDLWKKLEIDFDFYSRTTNENHKKSVQKIFSSLLEKGIIYKGKYKGLYSVQDEEFLTITQAEKKEDGYYHPQSGHKLTAIEEDSYFLKMSNFQEWLVSYFDQNKDFIKPYKIVNELKNNFLNDGLEDLSISRTTFDWGIPIFEDPKHILYVWLDALSNYITTLGYNSDKDANYQKYWKNGDEIVHIIGKEISRFHCIYWPIILEALDLKQPSAIISHGWIVTPQGKMSKSKGNVVDPHKLIDEYGSEVVKYFFASQFKLTNDNVFSDEILKSIYNSDLSNNYGNLLSRTIAMCKQNFKGSVKYSVSTNEFDLDIEGKIKESFIDYQKNFDEYKISEALQEAVKLSKALNGYIDKTEPWKLKEDKQRLEKVLNLLFNGLYAISTYLKVIMPNKANEAMKQLGLKNLEMSEILNFDKFDDVICERGDVLFERIK